MVKAMEEEAGDLDLHLSLPLKSVMANPVISALSLDLGLLICKMRRSGSSAPSFLQSMILS